MCSMGFFATGLQPAAGSRGCSHGMMAYRGVEGGLGGLVGRWAPAHLFFLHNNTLARMLGPQ